ncbi:hypothetical protein F9278_45295 [Streptomyces phaeolivaceus]|uniref:Isopropylmalate dehydrogenase-like domain-containing protein n=2 Tax=Streptomyces phaeolivaceus TaxID=2653200 RepID=A0A5P8KJG9_9ACTN|nr:hypothetical protein F9278_45295 [Streptomyces phaeolivaceus]
MAQASHGSAPDITGRGIANPVAMILSGAMLFTWLGAKHGDEAAGRVARTVERAVAETIASGVSTRDLGGSASTTEFTGAVVRAVGAGAAPGGA